MFLFIICILTANTKQILNNPKESENFAKETHPNFSTQIDIFMKK